MESNYGVEFAGHGHWRVANKETGNCFSIYSYDYDAWQELMDDMGAGLETSEASERYMERLERRYGV